MKTVGKPDAVIPYVRFDERRLETELWRELRHRHGRKPPANSTAAQPTVTAPVVDSTVLRPRQRNELCQRGACRHHRREPFRSKGFRGALGRLNEEDCRRVDLNEIATDVEQQLGLADLGPGHD
jgi:hypothetical protein